MSEHIFKIIPSDPYIHITEEKAQRIIQFIKQNVKADLVKVNMQESPAFIDCGANLESISCPHCIELLDFGWWGDVISNADENNIYKSEFIRSL